MNFVEDHWSKSAIDQWNQLPGHLKDQVEALVRDICRDPEGPLARKVPNRDRTWAAEISEVAVYYKISRGKDFILIDEIAWRG